MWPLSWAALWQGKTMQGVSRRVATNTPYIHTEAREVQCGNGYRLCEVKNGCESALGKHTGPSVPISQILRALSRGLRLSRLRNSTWEAQEASLPPDHQGREARVRTILWLQISRLQKGDNDQSQGLNRSYGLRNDMFDIYLGKFLNK